MPSIEQTVLSMTIKLSIIVPVFNEVGTIVRILREVRNQKLPEVKVELIVVDDGSSDGTGELLEQDPGLYDKFIRRPQNGGKGAAVRDGLGAASGDFILFQDADLEYDPGDYHLLVEPLLRLDADIVVGSRFIAPQITRVHYFWHKIGNRFLTTLFNILFNTTFTDIYSCYLLYRRSLVDPDALKSNGWDQQAEILSTAVRGNPRIYEVPVRYYGRTYEEGKKIKAKHAFAVIRMIIRKRLIG